MIGAVGEPVDVEVSSEAFCYVTTVGRRTGRPHRIEIWFRARRRTLYLLSGGGDRSDWVRNLRHQPRCSVEVGSRTHAARARFTLTPEEERAARRMLAAKYQGWREGLPFSSWAATALVVALDLAG
ncbi:MAG TPA: nitroreductase family deazaflavin-dependent oxidoreductase [Actinomycetota bacterium]|nr:nitroreductase family deazaflavin-dependent oxidoreductase [Actinomycetota bacterium]